MKSKNPVHNLIAENRAELIANQIDILKRANISLSNHIKLIWIKKILKRDMLKLVEGLKIVVICTFSIEIDKFALFANFDWLDRVV